MEQSKYDGHKFNKHKCQKCRYRKKLTSAPSDSVFCDYAGVMDQTCLHVVAGELIDRRGEDYDNCQLYSKGDPIYHKSIVLKNTGDYYNG